MAGYNNSILVVKVGRFNVVILLAFYARAVIVPSNHLSTSPFDPPAPSEKYQFPRVSTPLTTALKPM